MVLSKKGRARKRQELLDLLSDFGISMDDLVYLPEAIKIVKNLLNNPVQATPQEKERIVDKSVATPSQIIEMFSTEVEVLNFDGRK
jgi:hypothetical protein